MKLGKAGRTPAQTAAGAPAAARFRLARHFALMSAGMFALVAAALAYFEWSQGSFFQQVQTRQAEFFQATQEQFARTQDEVARRDLLAIHEAGNVNLTRLFANALWEHDLAPFAALASQVPVEACREIPDVADPNGGKPRAPPEKKACFAEAGRKIMALPGFEALNAKVFDSMKRSTVFKVKVFDLRGITVYSSEHVQIGEDKAFNAGWKSAAAGRPASELTHRDKFSAFEGVVEQRDLIGSYLPVHAPGTDRVVAVFEVYSDVTGFLAQIKATSQQLKRTAATNQARLQATAAESQAEVDQSSQVTLATVLGLMVVLFGALFVIVRRADAILARQAQERDQAHQQLAQTEKMASLGQMVAGVAHQLNTPLAFSEANVRMATERLRQYELPLKVATRFAALVRSQPGDAVQFNVARARAELERIDAAELDVAEPIEMLGDTLQGIGQMRELVDNLREFTRLDRSKTVHYDINRGLHNVAYIARSVIPPRIRIVEQFGDVPALECNASQLNQVFLNLINNAAQAIEGEGEIVLRTRLDGPNLCVDVRDSGSGIAPDVLPHIFDDYYTTKEAGSGTGLGLPIARSIVRQHGGEVGVATRVGEGTTFTVTLPLAAPARSAPQLGVGAAAAAAA